MCGELFWGIVPLRNVAARQIFCVKEYRKKKLTERFGGLRFGLELNRHLFFFIVDMSRRRKFVAQLITYTIRSETIQRRHLKKQFSHQEAVSKTLGSDYSQNTRYQVGRNTVFFITARNFVTSANEVAER